MTVAPRSLISRRQVIAGMGATALFSAAAAQSHIREHFQAKRTIRIGYISPMTGRLSMFTETDNFLLGLAAKIASSGLSCGGRRYAVEIIPLDDESLPERATALVDELARQRVDLVLAHGPYSAAAIAARCEEHAIPCLTTTQPVDLWQSILASRGIEQPRFARHFHFTLRESVGVLHRMWNVPDVNPVVGVLRPESLYGNQMIDGPHGIRAMLPDRYRVVNPAPFKHGTENFARFITDFKSAGVEIVYALCDPPEWRAFWAQVKDMKFHPKIATVSKALFRQSDAEAFGIGVDGMSTEIWWSPELRLRSALTGATPAGLGARYLRETGKPWCQQLGIVHSLWEAGFAALASCADPHDGPLLAASLLSLEVDTLVGRLSWRATGNGIATMPLLGGQWQMDRLSGRPQLCVTTPDAVRSLQPEARFKLL